MFVVVGGVLAVILIAVVLCRGYPVARVLFGGVLCLLGLWGLLLGLSDFDSTPFHDEGREFASFLAFGAFFFGGWMIISAWEADKTRRQQSSEWVARRKQLRNALAAETEPGKIALLKHDLERHEANAPDESYTRDALADAEKKEADGARGI